MTQRFLLRIGVVFLMIMTAAACGLIADAVSDASATEVDNDLFPPMDITGDTVQPLVFVATVDQDNPTYAVPEAMVSQGWGPIIAAHNASVAAGDDPLFRVEVGSLILEGLEPLQFDVVVSSFDGVVRNASQPTEQAIAECTFSLNPLSDTAVQYGANMTSCLTKWVATNGTPNRLTYEVTVLPESIAPQKIDLYRATHSETMLALNNVEIDCFERNLKVDSALLDNWDVVTFENFKMHGDASWEALAPIPNDPTCVEMAGPLFLWGEGSVMDAPTVPTPFDPVHADVLTSMPRSSSVIFEAEGDEIIVNGFNAGFDPLPLTVWMETLLNIAHSVAQSNADSGDNFKAVTGCYVVAGHCPRLGHVNFKVAATGRFDSAAAAE